MDYVKFIFRPLAARAARRAVGGGNRQSPDEEYFTRADVDSFLKTAWARYAERVGKLPFEPKVGSRMNVRLTCFTMAFLDTLLASGVERGIAIEPIADAVWKVYRLWSAGALRLARMMPAGTGSKTIYTQRKVLGAIAPGEEA